MTFAAFLALFLADMPGAKAVAASSGEAAREKMLEEDPKKAKEARRAEELHKAKEAGFITISESGMNWKDAVAFCRQHGGKLPRINNSDAWDGKNPPAKGILIEGFGYEYRPWQDVGLPYGFYWTGLAHPASPGNSWVIGTYGGKVGISLYSQVSLLRVVCVP